MTAMHTPMPCRIARRRKTGTFRFLCSIIVPGHGCSMVDVCVLPASSICATSFASEGFPARRLLGSLALSPSLLLFCCAAAAGYFSDQVLITELPDYLLLSGVFTQANL